MGVAGTSFLVACSSAPPASTTNKKQPVDPGDDFLGDPEPEDPGLAPTTDPDSGAFGAAARPAKDASAKVDAGADDSGITVEKGYCVGTIKSGDLIVNELMMASRTGAQDDGEWVEIRSTRTCWLKVQGVSVESPRGATTNSVTISEDFELEPMGTFVVADSADETINHGLPGKVFAWAASDVLKNDGDTVTIKLGATVVDAATYPSFSNITPARSLAFPSDCPATVRSDWTRWSLTFDSWKTGFQGTPNAANDDVACY